MGERLKTNFKNKQSTLPLKADISAFFNKVTEHCEAADDSLQSLAQLAAMWCGAHYSFVCLADVDHKKQNSKFQKNAAQMTLENLICAHTIQQEGLFVVPDLRKNPWFQEFPDVKDGLGLRFCASVPLMKKDGSAIGALCVLAAQFLHLSDVHESVLWELAKQAQIQAESKELLKKSILEQGILAKTNSYQASVIQNVPSAIYIKDALRSMSYSLVNPAFANILDLSEQEILGKTDFEVMPLELAERNQKNDFFIFQGRQIARYENQEIATAVGKRFYNVTMVPIYTETQEPHLLIGIMRDTTEEMHAKAALETERVKSMQSAKLASIGEIAAGVAHEINNPLTVISGALAILEKSRDDRDKFAAKAKSIAKSVERISKIVRGLKRFASYGQQKAYTHVALSNILREALEMIETKAKMLSVDMNVKIQSHASVFCNELEIEQVIINLLSNAIYAIRDLEDRWVEITIFMRLDHLVLRIVDSGSGVSQEVEKKLFEPFFTTKPAGEGTGLGLSISKEILGRHRATIALNRAFANTCFEVCFLATKMSGDVG